MFGIFFMYLTRLFRGYGERVGFHRWSIHIDQFLTTLNLEHVTDTEHPCLII